MYSVYCVRESARGSDGKEEEEWRKTGVVNKGKLHSAYCYFVNPHEGQMEEKKRNGGERQRGEG